MPTPLSIRYQVATDPADMPAIGRLLHHAFAGPPDKCQEWVRVLGVQHMRMVWPSGAPQDSQAAACLALIPMGQYFGGRSVPMVGYAGVAVAPESRGGGLALAMMRESMQEIRRTGAPLSCLYASTQTLYRQVGFEQAGHRFRHEIEIARLGVRDRSMHLRALAESDETKVRACYAQFAGTIDGSLDRGEQMWARTRKLRDVVYAGWGVFADASPGADLEGYVFLTQVRDPASGRHDLSLSDIAFTTARAGTRLLGFIADFSSMARTFDFFGGPVHPLLNLLPQQVFKSERKDYWMLRIVDAPAAIAARGFPQGVSASVTMRVHDDLMSENEGSWRLSVQGGRGSLERLAGGAACDAEMDIRGLACIFAGFLTPSQARLTGLLSANESGLSALSSAFPGGCPSMTDMF
jgi:predicted acetyltransferase